MEALAGSVMGPLASEAAAGSSLGRLSRSRWVAAACPQPMLMQDAVSHYHPGSSTAKDDPTEDTDAAGTCGDCPH